jgi:hypothetical protein
LPTPELHAELLRLNQLIRDSGQPFVDRYALVVDPANPQQIRGEYRHADGIHITRTGQARIADEAIKLLRKIAAPIAARPVARNVQHSLASL